MGLQIALLNPHTRDGRTTMHAYRINTKYWPLQTLDQDLGPQQTTLPDPTNMFKRPNIWSCYGMQWHRAVCSIGTVPVCSTDVSSQRRTSRPCTSVMWFESVKPELRRYQRNQIGEHITSTTSRTSLHCIHPSMFPRHQKTLSHVEW